MAPMPVQLSQLEIVNFCILLSWRADGRLLPRTKPSLALRLKILMLLSEAQSLAKGGGGTMDQCPPVTPDSRPHFTSENSG